MEKKLEDFKQRTVEVHQPLEMNKMEEARRMCNTMSVNLLAMTQQRDKESAKVEMLEAKMEDNNAFIGSLSDGLAYAQRDISRTLKEASRLMEHHKNSFEILNAFKSGKRRRCE